MCGVIGFSISVGYAQDGLGKGSGYISLNYATGVEAGIGINGFTVDEGKGVRALGGENQSFNISLLYTFFKFYIYLKKYFFLFCI